MDVQDISARSNTRILRGAASFNPALNLAPSGRWTLRDKAAQRPLALRKHQEKSVSTQPAWVTRGKSARELIEELIPNAKP
jgi:hypothetical protein